MGRATDCDAEDVCTAWVAANRAEPSRAFFFPLPVLSTAALGVVPATPAGLGFCASFCPAIGFTGTGVTEALGATTVIGEVEIGAHDVGLWRF